MYLLVGHEVKKYIWVPVGLPVLVTITILMVTWPLCYLTELVLSRFCLAVTTRAPFKPYPRLILCFSWHIFMLSRVTGSCLGKERWHLLRLRHKPTYLCHKITSDFLILNRVFIHVSWLKYCVWPSSELQPHLSLAFIILECISGYVICLSPSILMTLYACWMKGTLCICWQNNNIFQAVHKNRLVLL